MNGIRLEMKQRNEYIYLHLLTIYFLFKGRIVNFILLSQKYVKYLGYWWIDFAQSEPELKKLLQFCSSILWSTSELICAKILTVILHTCEV